MIRIQYFNFIISKFLQMSKLLCNVLKISGGHFSPPNCTPGYDHLTWNDPKQFYSYKE